MTSNEEKTDLFNLKPKSLKDYIIELFKVGGFPLVLYGLAGLNMLDILGTSNPEISFGLLALGFLTWIVNIFISTHRWDKSVAAKTHYNHDTLTSFANIISGSASDVAKEKANILATVMKDLGYEINKIPFEKSPNPNQKQ